jgi:hypothetical protein
MNQNALDTAVRRFPWRLLQLQKHLHRKNVALHTLHILLRKHWPTYARDITEEYRRIVKIELGER